jgi:hypothetical protein
VSSDTALMAAVPTCGLGRVGETAGSVRHSGVGYNCYEGISEWYPSGISHVLVGAVHFRPFSHFSDMLYNGELTMALSV